MKRKPAQSSKKVEIELLFEQGASDSKIDKAVLEACDYLDTAYREENGSGFRMPDVVEDGIMGVQIWREGEKKVRIELCLLPRNLNDSSRLVEGFRQKIATEEFQRKLKAAVENSISDTPE